MNVSGLTVKDIMQHDVIRVEPTATLRELCLVLSEAGIGGAPVVDGSEAIVGMVSATDVVRAVARPGSTPVNPSYPLPESLRKASPRDDMDRLRVKDVMLPATFSVRPGTRVTDLARVLVEAGIHRAPVLEEGALVGIVTTLDIVEALGPVGTGAGSGA